MAISTARILISNDDGIHAPGIQVLERIARELSDDVWVIAPEEEQSGAGHSLTLTKPLRVREVGEKRWAVSGTPTDCVMMAVNHIMKDNLPTLILSGINRGGNLAEDITYSGTVSVAMEGTLAGIPSIALSLCIRPEQRTKWETAEKFAPIVLEKLIQEGWDKDVLVNVNFPAFVPDEIKGIKVTEQGRREMVGNNIEERVDPRGFKYFWFGLGREVGLPGHETDIKTVREKWISVTPLHLDLTHHQTREKLVDKIDMSFD
ncbi:5'/3'-nucleotidase SurE [Kordiimonas sp. SCSIO 12610]|uniref:5'/3'-nucleotidase SurE n=1 Tax=Kordiimonas sp. SCSIO 12610 TaxID=2829597 RepID=UPI00210DE5F0|nr:5'/3'-nucleotidase SurE [Kordiimonas sp. SCSIO 12610]